MRIAVDGMGGDFAPEAAVRGAALAAAEYGVDVTIVGRPEALQPLMDRHPRLELVAATEVVEMDEHPAQAVRRKQDSSMSVCARLCRDGGADGWVSAGNSGAIMAAALFIQGRLPGVERPALGSVVPTADGLAYFVDVGANVDARPEYLVQFALMGTAYFERMFHVLHPRVGLLSNGEEPGKGSELVKAAYAKLAEAQLNFVGNVEGKDVFGGKADVVIADGFVGNVAIKMAEATAEFLFRTLRDEIPRSLTGKLGGLLIRSRIREIRARLDWREFGGAPLLGIDGVAVVAHGRSDATAVKNAIRVARDAVGSGLVANIRQAVAA